MEEGRERNEERDQYSRSVLKSTAQERIFSFLA